MNEEMEIIQSETCECQTELEGLRARVDLLTMDNAELISENLELRAKAEALLEARAALPEFSVRTETLQNSDRYIGVREAFKNVNSFMKRR